VFITPVAVNGRSSRC